MVDVTAGATFFVAGALPPRAARFDALPMAADAEALTQAMRWLKPRGMLHC
jgi:hypothetical protein